MLDPVTAVVVAVVLAGCVWLALVPPPGLASSGLARRLGIGAAVALGLAFVLTSRLADRDHGVSDFLLAGPVVVFFAGSAVAAAAEGSFRAGVQAAVWTALVGTLLVFVIGLPEALHWYRVDGRLLLDGERGYAFGESLGSAIWMLVLIPVWGLPFGVIGAAVGNHRRLGGRGRGPDRGTGRAGTVSVAAGLLLIAVGAILAAMHRLPNGAVIPNVDHAAVGYLLILVGLVATPILLLLWNPYGPGRPARLLEEDLPVTARCVRTTRAAPGLGTRTRPRCRSRRPSRRTVTRISVPGRFRPFSGLGVALDHGQFLKASGE
jgi:hypothetical protein